jgi:HAD superfamily hydrolase (TIGR01549 family)
MPLDVSIVRLIIFDVDGTLSDTDDLFVQKLERLLHPLRFLFRDKNTRRVARKLVMAAEAPGNFLMGIPDSLGVDNMIASLVERFNQRRSHPRRDFLLIPDVKEMLQELSRRYPLAIVSARAESVTRLFLERFDLAPFFKLIVTAQTVEHTKPWPDPILYVAQKLEIMPESCLMVGDTSVDIRAGKAAGTQTIGVLCGFGERGELIRSGADLILHTTADLLQVLED